MRALACMLFRHANIILCGVSKLSLALFCFLSVFITDSALLPLSDLRGLTRYCCLTLALGKGIATYLCLCSWPFFHAVYLY